MFKIVKKLLLFIFLTSKLESKNMDYSFSILMKKEAGQNRKLEADIEPLKLKYTFNEKLSFNGSIGYETHSNILYIKIDAPILLKFPGMECGLSGQKNHNLLKLMKRENGSYKLRWKIFFKAMKNSSEDIVKFNNIEYIKKVDSHINTSFLNSAAQELEIRVLEFKKVTSYESDFKNFNIDFSLGIVENLALKRPLGIYFNLEEMLTMLKASAKRVLSDGEKPKEGESYSSAHFYINLKCRQEFKISENINFGFKEEMEYIRTFNRTSSKINIVGGPVVTFSKKLLGANFATSINFKHFFVAVDNQVPWNFSFEITND